jgi:phosphotransferase system HPr-like phosphotransfer protein
MIAEEEIVEKTLTVGNRLGLHARVATMIVRAQGLDCMEAINEIGRIIQDEESEEN